MITSARVQIQNEEHISAHQDAVNKQQEEWRANMSKADQKRFEAIGKCFEILKEADVSAYMFPILRTNSGEFMAYQYNNGLDFIKYDTSGKFTEETKERLSAFNTLFTYTAFTYLSDMIFRGGKFDWDGFCKGLYSINSTVPEQAKGNFYGDKE